MSSGHPTSAIEAPDRRRPIPLNLREDDSPEGFKRYLRVGQYIEPIIKALEDTGARVHVERRPDTVHLTVEYPDAGSPTGLLSTVLGSTVFEKVHLVDVGWKHARTESDARASNGLLVLLFVLGASRSRVTCDPHFVLKSNGC